MKQLFYRCKYNPGIKLNPITEALRRLAGKTRLQYNRRNFYSKDSSYLLSLSHNAEFTGSGPTGPRSGAMTGYEPLSVSLKGLPNFICKYSWSQYILDDFAGTNSRENILQLLWGRFASRYESLVTRMISKAKYHFFGIYAVSQDNLRGTPFP